MSAADVVITQLKGAIYRLNVTCSCGLEFRPPDSPLPQVVKVGMKAANASWQEDDPELDPNVINEISALSLMISKPSVDAALHLVKNPGHIITSRMD